MTHATDCDGSRTGANREPNNVSSQALPEASTFRCCEGGVPLAHKSSNFRRVVGSIELRRSKLGLTGTAILDVVIKRFQIDSRNLGASR